MSVLGKIVGGTAGMMFGGPLGAIVGGMLGHAFDQRAEEEGQKRAQEWRRERLGDQRAGGPTGPFAARVAGNMRAAFAVGIVSLAAKLAKVDGTVTRDEVSVFKRVFKVQPGDESLVGRVFNEARRTAAGFEDYARQVALALAGNRQVLEEMIDGLFQIAKADGILHPAEVAYIAAVAKIFGFDDIEFERIRGRHMGNMAPDPYVTLGVEPGIDNAELKKVYRRLIREHHPDSLMANGSAQAEIDKATERLARINAAYDQIAKARGLA